MQSDEKPKSKMGRPPIVIDWKEFDKLCALQCLQTEIASWFECSVDTIENKVKETHGVTFSEYYKQKRGKGRIALRRMQMQAAEKGNSTMLVWLGKQYLNQTDKINQTETTTHKISSAELQELINLLKDE